MGYWLAEPFGGKEIMTPAVKALGEYALNELSFCRIYAELYAMNLASAKVLEKSDFALEGIMCSNVVKHDRVLDQLHAKVKQDSDH